ncbi:response regulator [Dyella marensis]|uniref:response regulator n=1 Tax=Dyella marensis TaxID=500610 RepID=UPI0031CF3056
MHVLLVEDSLEVAEVSKAMLEYLGFEVSLAHRGDIGLQCILHQRPALVITDFMMPVMSGLEMIGRARDAQYAGGIILCSAMPELELPVHRASYNLFLQKPYRLTTLASVMAAAQSCIIASGTESSAN